MHSPLLSLCIGLAQYWWVANIFNYYRLEYHNYVARECGCEYV